jgi:hypothetical protein
MKQPKELFNLPFLRSLSAEGRLKVIKLVTKLSAPYRCSWPVLYDAFRIIGTLANVEETVESSQHLLIEVKYTLPTKTNLKFIRLLRNMSRCSNLTEANRIMPEYDLRLSRDELDLIKLIMNNEN